METIIWRNRGVASSVQMFQSSRLSLWVVCAKGVAHCYPEGKWIGTVAIAVKEFHSVFQRCAVVLRLLFYKKERHQIQARDKIMNSQILRLVQVTNMPETWEQAGRPSGQRLGLSRRWQHSKHRTRNHSSQMLLLPSLTHWLQCA